MEPLAVETKVKRRDGFELLELSLGYGDQYVILVARPAETPAPGPSLALEDDLERTRALARRFSARARERIAFWRDEVQSRAAKGRSIVLWGAGSKAVAFLTTLGLQDEIEVLVDVNPYKSGRFMPSTGHEVILPESLPGIRPDCVIVMNPIYVAEIRRDLERMGLSPELLAL